MKTTLACYSWKTTNIQECKIAYYAEPDSSVSPGLSDSFPMCLLCTSCRTGRELPETQVSVKLQRLPVASSVQMGLCLSLQFPVPLSPIPSLLCQMEFPLIPHTDCTFSCSFDSEPSLSWSGFLVAWCDTPSPITHLFTLLQQCEKVSPAVSVSVPFPKRSDLHLEFLLGRENPQVSPFVRFIR